LYHIDWRRLHNEELHNLYTSANIIRVIKLRRMRLAGHVARRGEVRNAYENLVWKPERKRPLGKHRRSMSWENSVGYIGWMHLAQNRDQWRALVNTVMNFPTP